MFDVDPERPEYDRMMNESESSRALLSKLRTKEVLALSGHFHVVIDAWAYLYWHHERTKKPSYRLWLKRDGEPVAAARWEQFTKALKELGLFSTVEDVSASDYEANNAVDTWVVWVEWEEGK